MARPIEFDRSRAVNRALALFWRKGYQATSVADLVAAMGISRSSFCAAFTDKRHWGCMLVNTVLEMAGVDDLLAERASDHLGQVQGVFQPSLEAACATPDRAAELASVLLLLMQGMRVSRCRLTDVRHRHAVAASFRLGRGALA